ncbi:MULTISPECIES: MFS transporter [Paraburkholderia]|uniref:Aromatic acid/H+ symport family MFS transporter n=1 Tax=Paraburkholderia metrosideri TaxID=580937 RepID=A0ABW9E234_9BURK
MPSLFAGKRRFLISAVRKFLFLSAGGQSIIRIRICAAVGRHIPDKHKRILGDAVASISEIAYERYNVRTVSTIALCALVTLLDGFDAQAVGALAPSLAQHFAVPVSALGPMFGAAMFGLGIGAVAMGPIADRWGRRKSLILSTLVFAVCALLTTRAASLDQLVICRFATGLGLGGALPNTLALAAEYSPRRSAGFAVAVVSACVPGGGLLGGLAAGAILPRWGWQSFFFLGGTIPLLIAIALVFFLPESLKFLVARNADARLIRKIFRRMYLRDATDEEFEQLKPVRVVSGGPISALFTEGRAPTTALLWLTYFMNLLIMYFIVSWLPSLLSSIGLPSWTGARSIVLFSLGAIAGSLMQRRMSRYCGASPVMMAEFAVFSVASLWLANGHLDYDSTIAVAFLMGFCIVGAQIGLNMVVTEFYPITARATGLGWGLGIGRIGSIVGPLLGGFMLREQWSVADIFLAGIAPAVIAGCAMAAYGVRARAHIAIEVKR